MRLRFQGVILSKITQIVEDIVPLLTMEHYAKASKSRKSITNAQRFALRAWFYEEAPDTLGKTHRDASLWWEQSYGYRLNSSTVSEILSYKYIGLETSAGPHNGLDGRKRDRSGKWAELEEELVLWMHSVKTQGFQVSASLLRQKATELWYQIPCYQGLPCPKWSDGWRTRFEARYKFYAAQY